MRRIMIAMFTAIIALAFAVPALAAPGGVKGSPIIDGAILADGEAYGVILLGPLPYNGNDHSFDTLYVFPDKEQGAVAEAAPGKGYNGGRWIPTPVTWNLDDEDRAAMYPDGLTSASAVEAAADEMHVTIGAPMTDGAFLCPLIPNH